MQLLQYCIGEANIPIILDPDIDSGWTDIQVYLYALDNWAERKVHPCTKSTMSALYIRYMFASGRFQEVSSSK